MGIFLKQEKIEDPLNGNLEIRARGLTEALRTLLQVFCRGDDIL
jgi:hypothetical protein